MVEFLISFVETVLSLVLLIAAVYSTVFVATKAYYKAKPPTVINVNWATKREGDK